ncbi:hypothetical protein [Arthrobacter sp. UYEF3]|uniref:hypothetical protein n=1 Tax=Arthrobacter sp. UYEF3 TaxID=1756365 RepID=UPI0033955D0F
MDNTESQAGQPGRDSVESDPAYDFADDAPVGDAESVDQEVLEEAGRLVPLEAEDLLGDEQSIVPRDADEFREPEEGE